MAGYLPTEACYWSGDLVDLAEKDDTWKAGMWMGGNGRVEEEQACTEDCG